MPRVTLVILFAILNLLSIEVFSCSCSRAWRNSFLSNVGRFEVVAMGTIGRTNSDDGFDKPYLKIKKLYKGQVNDSIIQLVNGGLDCRHMWIADSEVQIIVGLSTDNYKNNQNEDQYYGAGCITSVLVLNENDRLTTNSKHIDYAGQVLASRISWLSRRMTIRKFERRIYLKTLFHEPEITNN
jgi:hypothetical protein